VIQRIRRDRHATISQRSSRSSPLRLKKSHSKFAISSAPKSAKRNRTVQRRAAWQFRHASTSVIPSLANKSAAYRAPRAFQTCSPGSKTSLCGYERDISHSSVERVILPDSTIFGGLHAFENDRDHWRDACMFPERMIRNLESTHGLIYSGQLLQDLVERGMPRDQAIMRRCNR